MTASTAPPMSGQLNFKLSFMMFLQYGIWGAWLPILYPFLMGHREYSLDACGAILAAGAAGAIVGPFIAGQIADRYFATEKFLAASHLAGALLVWFLSTVASFEVFLVLSVFYGLIYAPTISLTNSLAFHHMPDRDRDFGKVRVWGTIGWIVVGIAVGHWLGIFHTPPDDEAATRGAERLAMQRKDEAAAKPKVEAAIAKMTPDEKNAEIAKAIEGKEDTVKTDAEKELALLDHLMRNELKENKKKNLYDALAKIDRDSELDAGAKRKEAVDKHMMTLIVGEDQNAGRADAFRLSAILGIIMAIFCLSLPRTPPAKEAQAKSATFAALSRVKFQPLLTLFIVAVPISMVHQFYFVFASNFLTEIQNQAQAAKDAAAFINSILGVGGGGLMTVGQMAEIGVLVIIPLIAKKVSRKSLLVAGIIAYALRMVLFAYTQNMFLVILGVALHGFCFGCFIFVAYMVVDEETSSDVRASAQNLFNLVIVGIGIIVGSWFATSIVASWAATGAGGTLVFPGDYTRLFSVPMWIAIGCLVFVLALYPGKRKAAPVEGQA